LRQAGNESRGERIPASLGVFFILFGDQIGNGSDAEFQRALVGFLAAGAAGAIGGLAMRRWLRTATPAQIEGRQSK
jgi:drug/metabolite transporter (DMT)-like permease